MTNKYLEKVADINPALYQLAEQQLQEEAKKKEESKMMNRVALGTGLVTGGTLAGAGIYSRMSPGVVAPLSIVGGLTTAGLARLFKEGKGLSRTQIRDFHPSKEEILDRVNSLSDR